MDAWSAPGEMYDYKRSPTLQNAISFLKSLDVPIVPRTDTADSPTAKRSRRGGVVFDQSFAYVDLLHDLRGPNPIHPSMVSWILSCTTLPQDAVTRIVGYCASSMKNVTPSLAKEYANLPKPMMVYSQKNSNSNSNTFTIDKTMQLYNYISSLAQRYSGKVMPIVLDGIHHAFQKDMDDHDAAASLALCAFVQVLFSHIQPATFTRKTKTNGSMGLVLTTPRTSNAPSVASICFLTGKFQSLDIPMYNKFLDQLTKNLSQTVTWVTNAVTYRTQPCSHPGLTNKALILPSGVHVPLRGNILHGLTLMNRSNTEIATDLQNAFTLSYDKQQLRKLFEYLSLLTPSERPAFSQFIQTIANVNLFRDAFRADVAIGNQAVFITNDRMAQVYYCIQPGLKADSLLFTYAPGLSMCGVA